MTHQTLEPVSVHLRGGEDPARSLTAVAEPPQPHLLIGSRRSFSGQGVSLCLALCMFFAFTTCGVTVSSAPFREMVGTGLGETLLGVLMVWLSYTPFNLLFVSLSVSYIGQKTWSETGGEASPWDLWRSAIKTAMTVYFCGMIIGGILDVKAITQATQETYFALAAVVTATTLRASVHPDGLFGVAEDVVSIFRPSRK